MADVIDFLQWMGEDASLRHASEAVLDQAMRQVQIDAHARAALISGDRARIEATVGGGSNVCCLIYKPEDEEQETKELEQKVA